MATNIPDPKYHGNLDDFIDMLINNREKLSSVIIQGNAAWYAIRKLGIPEKEVFDIWNKDNPNESIVFTDKTLYPKEKPSNCEFYNKDYCIPCKSPDKFYECDLVKIGNQIKLDKWKPSKCEFCGRELILYNDNWICGHGCIKPAVKPKEIPSKFEFEHIVGCQCTECKPKEEIPSPACIICIEKKETQNYCKLYMHKCPYHKKPTDSAPSKLSYKEFLEKTKTDEKCPICQHYYFDHVGTGLEYLCRIPSDPIECNKCKLYGECDHQGAYKKDGKWCYEPTKEGDENHGN